MQVTPTFKWKMHAGQNELENFCLQINRKCCGNQSKSIGCEGENIPPTIKLKSKMEFTYRSYGKLAQLI